MEDTSDDDDIPTRAEYPYFLHNLLRLSPPRGRRTPPFLIIAFQSASRMAIEKLKELATPKDHNEMRTFILDYVSKTHLSDLFKQHGDTYANMVLDAVLEFQTPTGIDDRNYDIDHIFPDGSDHDLIGFHKVRGGTVKHSFFVEGVAFKKTRSTSTSQSKLNPKILLLDMAVPEDDDDKITFLQHCKDSGATVILFSSAVDDNSIKYIESYGIICVDQVDKYDMDRVAFATRTYVMKSFYHYLVQFLGDAMVFGEQRHENEVFYVFSGCHVGKMGTVVLYDADKFTETEEEILREEIIFVWSAMKNSTVVNRNTICTEISTYLKKEAPKDYQKLGKEYQKYMEIFVKSLEISSKEILDNAPAVSDATDLWEPAVVKIDALDDGSSFATYLA